MGKSLSHSGEKFRVPSYVASHELDWVGTNVKMGSQMPFMQNSIDSNGRLVVDETNAAEIRQFFTNGNRPGSI